ncbi:cytokinin dehydrogenase [Musa troglodytarum]|uniref:cytokinin dehydrogenase n=1 Tax=Musa troglodytarum TaxID=320322 RepID=A0A9E7F2R2_9LILI|nr:cytokinin dehydrogenase [Musa troglodytarum]
MTLRRLGLMPSTFLVMALSFVISFLSLLGQLRPWPATLPQGLLSLDIADELHYGPNATARFSIDYGRLTEAAPAAVLYPSSPDDIAALVRFSYASPRPFVIAARGHGHSTRGQAFAPGGVVVDMASLGRGRRAGRRDRINVPLDDVHRLRYVDAGGEQLWIDVLRETLEHGVAPRSWTDYLYLTVGGTLSNAGISGQAFRHGPQISNVHELDVITGKGDMVTCSRDVNSDLFYGVLGGLGQLGIITRARIAVEPAPQRVRWVRFIYTDFGSFINDQELLISISEEGFDYVEGQLLMKNGAANSSFFSEGDSEKIRVLAAEFGAIYFLEGAIYYELSTASSVDQKLKLLLKKLSFVPGFAFTKDVSYLRFLDRVHRDEIKLRPMGLWDVPHPWLNLFVPKSRMRDFETGIFRGILIENDTPMATVLISPMNKSKWDEKMSVTIPDEDIFYAIGILRSATMDDRKHLDDQNDQILRFCDQAGIEFKQYLPHYTTQADWKKHFGVKWDRFVQLKRRYDPKALLSPGQRIFTTSL